MPNDPGKPPVVFRSVAAVRSIYVDQRKGANPTVSNETLALKRLGADAAVLLSR